ncbi:MAG: molybdopterin-dependent oxidoreductase, partial [Spirochaetales bacterium]|nr:molybdopterin-dependent oxidoreductase [Spirochaetales bacterium]
MKENLKVVGHNAVRLDILEKVTGAAEYTDDIAFGPNLLHMAILGSPYAHAEIISIDTSEAKKLPGVKVVITGEDYPEKFGLYLKDKSIFPVDRVRQVGEQVAGVVAASYEIAKNAVKLIKVEYKELPVILDPYDSVAEGAVLIHPDLGNYVIEPWLEAQAGTNIGHLRRIRKGDIDKGFAEADEIVEGEYHIPHVAHTCIETHISVSKFSLDGRLTMWNSTQSPHTQRNIMATALGMA